MEFIKTQVSLLKQIVLRVKLVLTKPRDFFQSIKKEEGIGKAFIYLAILTLFNIVLGTIVIFILTGQAFLPFGIQGLIIDYVFSVLASFLFAGLFHLWMKLFGGKGNYKQTYRLYVYASTPKFLLGWIPYSIVSLLANVYFLVLAAVGSQELYGFSQRKSIVVFALLAVVLIILTFLAGFGIAALLGSMAISPVGK